LLHLMKTVGTLGDEQRQAGRVADALPPKRWTSADV
jgi:hypothetical protein